MDREFFLGFIKIHILYHAGKEAVSGVGLLQELARHGYRISPGTLYPTLHRLEMLGYLAREIKVEGGKRKIYYRSTDLGKRALSQARKKIRELVEEVMEDEEAQI
jgi:DNA-binding PadR family transcriptional regulator